MDRLETFWPDMAAKLKRESPEKDRAAALAACEFVIAQTELRHPLVDDALECLRTYRLALSPNKQSEIETLVASLDNEYFDLQEAADEGKACEEDYLRKFREARAVSALLFAFKVDSFEAASESVYEAAMAVKDNKQLFAVVESALGHDVTNGGQCL